MIKSTIALVAFLAVGAFSHDADARVRSVSTRTETADAPDFAFPDKVAAEADKQLDSALKSGDGKAVVSSLVRYSLARNAVSPTLIPPVLERIDSVKNIEPDVKVRSLLSLLQATIYNGIYKQQQWTYDQRQIPIDSISRDYTEWSGQQFKRRIALLLDEATSPRQQLLESKLDDWADIINADEYTYIFYPTLYDLIAYNAADIFEGISTSQEILPFRFVMPRLAVQSIPAMALVDNYSRRAHQLYVDLYEAHIGDTPAQIMAQISAIDCMSALVVQNDNDEGNVEDEDTPDSTDDAYMELYRLYAGTEWGDEALIAHSTYNYTDYIDAIRSALQKFPNYFRADALRQRLANAEQPRVYYNTFGYATPAQPFDIKLTLSNTTSATLYLIKSDAAMTVDPKNLEVTDGILAHPALRYDITLPERTKPFHTDTVISVTLPEPGYYYIWATGDGIKTTDRRFTNRYITCSDIAPFTFTFNGYIYPYAVNSWNGAPAPGTTVSGKTYRDTSYKKIGLTGTDGSLASPVEKLPELMISRDKQAIRYNTPWTYRNSDRERSEDAAIFTSLPLYHHGDTVSWGLIAYTLDNGKGLIATDTPLSVFLFDANGTKIDSVTVTTDKSGRATGDMILPSDGLSGQHSLRVFNGKRNIGTNWFPVNDYKLPTYTAAVTALSRSTNPDSLITVTCKAETYSGFPVSGAKVAVELNSVPRYWWNGSSGYKFRTTDTVTSADGSITLTLSRDLLDLAPIAKGRYSITFNVTSPGGENRSCTRVFTTGKPYGINCTRNADLNIDIPLQVETHVSDAMGNNVNIPLTYTIIDDNDTIATVTPGTKLPASVKPGVYDIIVSPVDTSLADPVTIDLVTLYRTKGECPEKTALYVPVTDYDATGDNVDILLGSDRDNANILVIKIVDNTVVSREWFTPRKGMQAYPVTIPAQCESVRLMLGTMSENRQINRSVIINNKRAERNLDITVESFRDKVIPGTPEQISLTVKENGRGIPASVIMRMESEAILSLHPHNLWLNTYSSDIYQFNVGSRYHYVSNTSTGHVSDYTWPSITSPSLNLYGLGFNRRFSTARRLYGSALGIVREHKEAVVVEESVTEDSAPAMMNSMAAADAGESELQEVVVTGYGIATKSSLTGSVTVGPTDNFSYRPSEIPLSFFAPTLSTDSLGSLTYTYMVPDANTSWALMAMAYTPDLLSASVSRTVVSSRPVMVQPTLPRFLRHGDRVSFRATVMNATDSVRAITTTVSILDPTDMSPLTSMTVTDTIAAGANAVVNTPFAAPTTGTALIYRVKSISGNYTDGEQALLPLLPASQPLITSASFYIPADSTQCDIDIEMPAGEGVSTLYMYDNPVWEVITALPSLNRGESVTSIGAMDNIYMASVARGILSRNPELKKALKQWLDSDRSDSTMTSMLSRNDMLKQLTLNATPWVRDAMSDTERLSSLALMLDDSNIDSTIKTGIKTLGQATTSAGGLTWCQGDGMPSQWATYRVLAMCASLSERGYLPDDKTLSDIISNAVDYIDKETAKSLKNNKGKGDYTRYAYIRSIIKSRKPSPTASRAISLTINNILKRWRNESTVDKATDAVILYHNNYPSMARQVVASIKAYSMHSASRGTWWDNLGVDVTANLLYAIETVTPSDSELISSVAQWLILSKTGQAWGNNSSTSSTIDALLGAINVNKAVNGTTSVSIDDTSVTSDGITFPGMIVTDITGMATSSRATLAVSKDTGLPAMGSVITRSTVPLDSIVAHSHPSVSIAKRINLVQGTTVVGADTLATGDRVRVQLVLKVYDDLDYVTLIDRHAACLEPADQLSHYTGADGLHFYREVTDSETRMYISRLPRGTYIIDTDMNIVAEGRFSSGVATVQSQLNPGITANSSARPLTVKR